ncbi:hypothetical protein PROFUN_01425 [Planoprotostelium fungivorum]|uniref:Calponin-homology (CH) domain-containing protein n=1 Tax=Planoprotostelium fungivorum TaxID=1890364 RepID=A0A2P6NT70_9EUKA|nr:hypothetical protein PROFUN_01425 [Planoprotostelium fungivorum]
MQRVVLFLALLSVALSQTDEIVSTFPDFVSLVTRLRANGTLAYNCTAEGVTAGPLLINSTLSYENGTAAGTYISGTFTALDGSFTRVIPNGQFSSVANAGRLSNFLAATLRNSGNGLLSNLALLSRYSTSGGFVNATETCTPTNVGTLFTVPFAASYGFYRAVAPQRAGSTLRSIYRAVGTLSVTCTAGNFSSPSNISSDLFTLDGTRSGIYNGSFVALDGSATRVTATNATFPVTSGRSLAYFLATALTTTGPLTFNNITNIVRYDTVGGVATVPCNSTNEGVVYNVPFEASYAFYSAATGATSTGTTGNNGGTTGNNGGTTAIQTTPTGTITVTATTTGSASIVSVAACAVFAAALLSLAAVCRQLREAIWTDEYIQKQFNKSSMDKSFLIFQEGETNWPKHFIRKKSAVRWNIGSRQHSFVVQQKDAAWCVDANDRFVCVGTQQGRLIVWDMKQLKQRVSRQEHSASLTTLQFDSKKIITTSNDKSVKLWDLNTARVDTLYHHKAPVTSLRFGTSLLFTGSEEGSLNVYDLTQQKILHVSNILGRPSSIRWREKFETLWVGGSKGVERKDTRNFDSNCMITEKGVTWIEQKQELLLMGVSNGMQVYDVRKLSEPLRKFVHNQHSVSPYVFSFHSDLLIWLDFLNQEICMNHQATAEFAKGEPIKKLEKLSTCRLSTPMIGSGMNNHLVYKKGVLVLTSGNGSVIHHRYPRADAIEPPWRPIKKHKHCRLPSSDRSNLAENRTNFDAFLIPYYWRTPQTRTTMLTAKEQTQQKILLSWVNYVLLPNGITIKNLQDDLEDGQVLSALFKNLGGTLPTSTSAIPTISGKMNTPRKKENVSGVLRAMQQDGLQFEATASDILAGDLKQILPLLTSMAEKYQMKDRSRLLMSISGVAQQHQLDFGGGLVKNFLDGKLLAAIVYNCLPGSFDLKMVFNMHMEDRVVYVTKLAHDKLQIPIMLTAEEIVFRMIDEFQLLLYVSIFLHSDNFQPNQVEELKERMQAMEKEYTIKIEEERKLREETVEKIETAYKEDIQRRATEENVKQEIITHEIDDYKTQLEEAQKKMAEMMEKMKELEGIIAETPIDPDLIKKMELEKHLRKQQEEYEKNVKRVQEVEEEKKRLEEALTTGAPDVSEEEKFKELLKERDDLVDEITDIKRQLLEEKTDSNDLRDRLMLLTEREHCVAEAKREVENKKAIYEAKLSDISRLEKEKKEAEKQAAKALEAVEKVKREMEELQRKMKAKLEEENRQKAKEKEEAQRIKKERDAFEKQYNSAETQNKKMTETVEQLRERKKMYKKKYLAATNQPAGSPPEEKKKKMKFLGFTISRRI